MVLISPRIAGVFHPLAECREQFKQLSYEGLANLALGLITPPYTHARTYATHAHTYMHTHTHTRTHTNTHTCAHTRTRVHTHIGAAQSARRPSHRLAWGVIN